MYLEVKNLSFAYAKKKVLKDISFSVKSGEITGLIGENGSGKTTTILNLIKTLEPQQGEVLLDGKNIKQLQGRDFPVTYIPDNPVYYEELTVWEHLQFVGHMYPKSTVNVEELVAHFGLEEHLNKTPGMLSKGTCQKLMLAIALLRSYALFLADEPFHGLDPRQIHLLKKTLLRLRSEGKAILISTHLLDLVENLCDRYLVIHEGCLIAQGTKEELLARCHMSKGESLEKLYLRLSGGGEGE